MQRAFTPDQIKAKSGGEESTQPESQGLGRIIYVNTEFTLEPEAWPLFSNVLCCHWTDNMLRVLLSNSFIFFPGFCFLILNALRFSLCCLLVFLLHLNFLCDFFKILCIINIPSHNSFFLLLPSFLMTLRVHSMNFYNLFSSPAGVILVVSVLSPQTVLLI